MPSFPQPYAYFAYSDYLSKLSNGTYKLKSNQITSVGYYVYDKQSGTNSTNDSANGQTDSAAQLGDVQNDNFVGRPKGSSTRDIYTYVGETADGKSFVANLHFNGKLYPYLFTNYNSGAYTRGTSSNPSNDPSFSVVNKPFTVCYVAGTLIRTTDGDVAVEQLAVGDVVITASGARRPIKWLGHRAYSGRLARSNPDLLPVCVKAGALSEGVPARDLWVSSRHAMFIDGVLIPAEHLVNGVTIVRAERAESIEYWHVELGSHDVLLAEGAPSESFVDDNGRGIFHNAHTFHAMYPDDERVEAVYCAPRIEDGYVLDAVRRRLAERAGLVVPPMLALGTLRGFLDLCDGTIVNGWAQDMAYPDAPVCLDIVVDGVRVAIVYAEHFREDLHRGGIGDGHHAFSLRFATPLSRDVAHRVEVRRSADGLIVGETSLEPIVGAMESLVAA